MRLKSELISLTKAVNIARPQSHFHHYYSDRLEKTKQAYLDKAGPCVPEFGCCYASCEVHNDSQK